MEGQRYENFGAMLYNLRATFAQRHRKDGELVRNIRITQQDVIKHLREKGYQISPGMYSEIESGSNYPRDAEAFLNAVSQCLDLSEDEEDELRLQLTYDIIRLRLGEEIANKVFERAFSKLD